MTPLSAWEAQAADAVKEPRRPFASTCSPLGMTAGRVRAWAQPSAPFASRAGLDGWRGGWSSSVPSQLAGDSINSANS